MKLKVISFVMVLLWGQALNIFPQITPKVSDFRISIDNFNPTFKQEYPVLFANSNKEFIVAWEDYRLGNLAYFAQRFDSLGNKIGTNFKVHSNLNIVLGNNSEFLNISETYWESYYGGGELYFYANIYDANNNVVAENISVGAASIPWCGTGYLGVFSKACKTPNGYAFGLNDDGYLNLIEMDERGNFLHEWELYENEYLLPRVVNFDMAYNDSAKIIAWVRSDEEDFFSSGTDTLTLLYSLKRDTSNIFSDSVIVKNYILDYWGDKQTINLKTLALTDTTFLLADLINDSLVLNYRIININDTTFPPERSISLIDTNSTYWYIKKFELSQLSEDKFLVYSIIRLEDYSQRKIYLFNNSGDLLSEYTDTISIYKTFGGKPFLLSDGEFLTAHEINSDVFLTRNNLIEEIDTLKINDDETGSNDLNPFISTIDESKYFVAWENESGAYGIKVNNNGTKDGNRIKLEGRQCIFSGESKCVNFWKKKFKNDQGSIGFTIYDSEWNKIQIDTIVSGPYYEISNSVIKLNDSVFVTLFNHPEVTKSVLYNFDGNKLNEKIISPTRSYGLRLYKEADNLFWINWGDNLQLYSDKLEPMTETYKIDFTHYLGNGKFLKLYNEAQPLDIVYWKGIILSAEGDTLVEEFNFDKIPNFRDSNPKIMQFKDKSEFAVLFSKYEYDKGRDFYWQVYGFDGLPKPSNHRINSNDAKWTRDITYKINGNDVFFLWADVRDGNLGYDIYGNIYDSGVITAISKDENPNILPEEFVLYQNYPNPFNPSTTIKYSLPQITHHLIPSLEGNERSDRSVLVTLKVYDVLGREVATLVNEVKSPGYYTVTFNASSVGGGLPSGIYFYKLTAGNFSAVKKMILMK